MNGKQTGGENAADAILRVVDDGPDELAELRGVLVREQAWRLQHGL